MRKLYALSMSAKRDFQSGNFPGVCLAIDDEQALGKAIKAAREKLPESEGWYSHQASVLEVPTDIIEQAWEEIQKVDSSPRDSSDNG